ncbi:DUF2752 domain-containing protein [Jatrophihabitans sp. YIM 134969]
MAVGVAAAGVVAFDPVHHDVPLCPFHVTTGLWCPFCGGLRAVWLLAHLQIGAAASSSLVVFALAPWFAWRAFRTVTGRPPVIARWRGHPLPRATVPVVVVTLLVVYTVLRNLPAGSALAPAS